ncbi:unnamed protein product [Cuscuta europaea]|uniref:RIN4 pathogenic type III effector avirulence factor Avr cleavage site domain-containing protein n=1 Tax=Cuscuta europaea TaxID=41803 RepID=A0A9P0ZZ84_CUSEU|nr:unnamed protein product [Cuscuta europaea]
MATERKRSAGSCGHIPAFGGWDAAADLPITQYFESARHAGLTRNPSERAATDLNDGVANLRRPPPSHPAAGDAVLPATKVKPGTFQRGRGVYSYFDLHDLSFKFRKLA